MVVYTQPPLVDLDAAAREPEWRIRLYGPPLTVHDPRCWLDPRHHRLTPCSWPAEVRRG